MQDSVVLQMTKTNTNSEWTQKKSTGKLAPES